MAVAMAAAATARAPVSEPFALTGTSLLLQTLSRQLREHAEQPSDALRTHATTPIVFKALDACIRDENLPTLPSTVTIQWRLPWPRMDYDAFLLRRNDKAIISQCIYSTCTHLAAPLLTSACAVKSSARHVTSNRRGVHSLGCCCY
eukprot:COSAG03_NODE_1797_length_3507_cov_380.294014_5_plen_146_part_00